MPFLKTFAKHTLTYYIVVDNPILTTSRPTNPVLLKN